MKVAGPRCGPRGSRLLALGFLGGCTLVVSCANPSAEPARTARARAGGPRELVAPDIKADTGDRRESGFLALPQLQPRIGAPLSGLTPQQLALFEEGKQAFIRTIDPDEGLGPLYNMVNCAACHSNPTGGSGSLTVTLFGRREDDGTFSTLAQLGGPIFHGEAIRPECQQRIPREANMTAERITTSCLGAGLIEAVPDGLLRKLAASSPSATKGRVHWVHAVDDRPDAEKRAGRFGWKCQIATVLSFSASASALEMGFTNHLIPREIAPNGSEALLAACDNVPDPEDLPDDTGLTYLDRITYFQRYLAPPPQTPRSGMTGERTFEKIGCADCHHAALTTLNEPGLESPLRGKTIKPYSDFLLHDMGALGDGYPQGDARANEFRTTPLWGFRFRFPLLHDGRVSGAQLAERATRCIELHKGQAAASVKAFKALPKPSQQRLIDFLDSLGRVEFDADGDNDVDLADWPFFFSCLARPISMPISPDNKCSIGDIDRNGHLDLVDYALLQGAFTGPLYGSVMIVP